ncbi:hypothetical protein pb186bvf_000421 [Paramecium bursaria]
MINLISSIADGQLHTENMRQQFVDIQTLFRLLSKEGEVGKDKIRELVELNEDEIDYIMHKLDIDQDNKVSLRDFIEYVRPQQDQMREKLILFLQQEAINYNKIQAAKETIKSDPKTDFNRIDYSNKGFITQRSLKLFTQLPQEQVSAFFRAIGTRRQGKETKILNFYKELRKSQEKERQCAQQQQLLQQNALINEQKQSQQRLHQIEQMIQNRQHLEGQQETNAYKSLLRVRQQLMQIDYIRRNSLRDAFERQIKQQYLLIKDLKNQNKVTAQKSKHLNEVHDQLYTMRTQQDLTHKRPREISLHSQSQL